MTGHDHGTRALVREQAARARRASTPTGRRRSRRRAGPGTRRPAEPLRRAGDGAEEAEDRGTDRERRPYSAPGPGRSVVPTWSASGMYSWLGALVPNRIATIDARDEREGDRRAPRARVERGEDRATATARSSVPRSTPQPSDPNSHSPRNSSLPMGRNAIRTSEPSAMPAAGGAALISPLISAASAFARSTWARTRTIRASLVAPPERLRPGGRRRGRRLRRARAGGSRAWPLVGRARFVGCGQVGFQRTSSGGGCGRSWAAGAIIPARLPARRTPCGVAAASQPPDDRRARRYAPGMADVPPPRPRSCAPSCSRSAPSSPSARPRTPTAATSRARSWRTA